MIGDVIASYAAIVATAAVAIPIWQSRRGRRPQIELALIHTQGETKDGRRRAVTLEARNRGDHPIRIIGAGISSPRMEYTFRPDNIHMSQQGGAKSFTIDLGDQAALDSLKIIPLPGIILPRDGAGRFITDALAAVVMEIGLIQAEKGDAAAPPICGSFAAEIEASFDEELVGWVSVSTGEYLETKPVKFDWSAAFEGGAR